MSEAPKFKAPSGGGIKRTLGVLATLVLLCAMVIFFVVKFSSPEESSNYGPIAVQEGVDTDFFNIPDPAPAPVEKIAPPAPPAPAKKLAPPPPPPPPPAPRLKLADLNPVQTQDRDTSRIKAINAKRRGASGVHFSNGGTLFPVKVSYKLSQKQFDEPQTKASLPVDLSRTVTEDRFISAILINEISSELPGKVVAQISHHVYGMHGRKILIPAGTKAVGRYEPLEKLGNTRISIIWHRLITPAGINIHTGDAEMTDAMGRSGLTGEVDNKYFERYGTALLISTLATAAAVSIPVNTESSAIAIDKFGNNISELTKEILERNIDLAPVVTIPAGSRIIIQPTTDVWFKIVSRDSVQLVRKE